MSDLPQEKLMEHYFSNMSENCLSVERDTYQSTSAPTSPTKVPLCRVGGASGDDPFNNDAPAYVAARCGSISFDIQNRKGRSVKFPEDHSIVTGYHEAPDPYRYGELLYLKGKIFFFK